MRILHGAPLKNTIPWAPIPKYLGCAPGIFGFLLSLMLEDIYIVKFLPGVSNSPNFLKHYTFSTLPKLKFPKLSHLIQALNYPFFQNLLIFKNLSNFQDSDQMPPFPGSLPCAFLRFLAALFLGHLQLIKEASTRPASQCSANERHLSLHCPPPNPSPPAGIGHAQ